MAENLQNNKQLLSQLKNSYGKVSYSLTAHEKEIQFLEKVHRIIKLAQIVLSAISAGSIISILFGQSVVAQIIASIMSVLLLVLNSITLKFDLASDISRHKDATNRLWLIRERYLSLITDFDILDKYKIRNLRDELMNKTNEIYSYAPKTSSRSYKKTQKALKVEEEQFFTVEELNQLLPPDLRTK